MNGGRDWKSAMLTLEDTAFFDLMRAWLGPVKTPFNKHHLIDALETMLQKPEVRRRIFVLIDNDDRKVLTAVSILGEPEDQPLYDFFEGEYPYIELHHRLLNLEERLLLYRENMDGKKRIRINPYLLEALSRTVIDPVVLFPSRDIETVQAAPPWLTDPLLVSSLSYLLSSGDLMKNDGGLRKKTETDIASMFPELALKTVYGTRIFLLFDALTVSGLAVRTGSSVVPDLDAWDELAAKPREERYFTLWAAAAGSASPGLRHAMKRFLDSLSPRKAFGKAALERLAGLTFSRRTIGGAIGADRFIQSLAALGLLVRIEDEYVKNPHLEAVLVEAGSDEPAAVIQPNFILTLKPWVKLKDALVIALTAEIRRHDLYPQFEITSGAATRAFRRGLDAGTLITALERLSGGNLSQNIAWTLSSWGKEYGSVGLYRGIVLQVDEERRHLIEHTVLFENLIVKTIAPGIYMISEDDLDRLRTAMNEAGIRMLPEVETVRSGFRDAKTARSGELPADDPEYAASGFTVPLNPGSGEIYARPEDAGTDSALLRPDREEAERIMASLLETLGKVQVPSDIRETLSERIREKLIILPEQIRADAVRKEKTEAKGLDYLGKVRLIEQALRSRTELIEIIVRTAEGDPERMLLSPRALEKRNTDLILLGTKLPHGEEETVAVSKIAFVRKIRGSLYRG